MSKSHFQCGLSRLFGRKGIGYQRAKSDGGDRARSIVKRNPRIAKRFGGCHAHTPLSEAGRRISCGRVRCSVRISVHAFDLPSARTDLLSSIERLWTADEPIAPNVESQRTVGCARNADPFALPDFVRRLTVRSEPQRARLTEVDPVQPAINPQGFAQPSRAPRQVSYTLGAAVSLHDCDADGRLDRPGQNARAQAGRLARDVQHERAAIG